MFSFWQAAWARGRRPRDIARNIFRISKSKNRTLQDAVHRHNWVRDIDLRHGINMASLNEYVDLWSEVALISLDNEGIDDITWKFCQNGVYSAASAYKAQFLGSTLATWPDLIWKTWAPEKCKLFACS